MNTTSGIYVIEHRESGKRYVGRAKNIPERWALHRRDAERRSNKTPLHRAFRKYGFDAFDWKILVLAPSRLHVQLEGQFIADFGTQVPKGYNVGGPEGGMPSAEMLARMDPETRAIYAAEYRARSAKMHATLRERRKDPDYDRAYCAAKKEAALKREERRRKRLAEDPNYAAREARRRSLGGVKAAATRKARRA